MNATTRIFLMLATLGAASARAQTPADSLVQPPLFRPADSARTLDQKLDKISIDVTDIKKDVGTIRGQLVESPLGDRAWGVELNPLGILFADKGPSFAGTVSNFSWDRSAEVALPFYFLNKQGDGAIRIINLDAQYRRFLGGRQRGFYLSGFTRFQHARYQPEGFESWWSGEEPAYRTINRLGLGFGLGGRIFSRPGFYWGWNVSAGRFLVGDKIRADEFPASVYLLDDLILDMELLKIGFAF